MERFVTRLVELLCDYDIVRTALGEIVASVEPGVDGRNPRTGARIHVPARAHLALIPAGDALSFIFGAAALPVAVAHDIAWQLVRGEPASGREPAAELKAPLALPAGLLDTLRNTLATATHADIPRLGRFTRHDLTPRSVLAAPPGPATVATPVHGSTLTWQPDPALIGAFVAAKM